MELKDYFRLLRRRWWLLLLCLTLGGAGAYAATQAQTKVYGSSLTFVLTSDGRPATGEVAESAEGRFLSYDTLVRSTDVRTRVLAEAALTPSFFNAGSTQLAGTVFLRVSVESGSPGDALALARAYAAVLPDYVRSFEGGTSGGSSISLRVFEPPTATSEPLSPDGRRNVLAGLALGLILGLVAALVLESLDSRVRASTDLEESTGLGVFATVPLENRGRSLVLRSHPRSPRAESIRQVRANLQFAALDKPLHVLVVTSAVPGEGKTSVAADLALAYAEAGQSVVLVDADLRKPRLAEVFDLANTPGLTDVLVGDADLDACLVTQQPDAHLRVLTSGTLPARPSELLGSEAMAVLVDALADRADLVIIDSAPLLPVADTAALLVHVDAVLLVVRLGGATRKQVRSAVERLRSFQSRVVGLVANGGRDAGAEGYYLANHSRFGARRQPTQYLQTRPVVPVRAAERSREEGQDTASSDLRPTGPADEEVRPAQQ